MKVEGLPQSNYYIFGQSIPMTGSFRELRHCYSILIVSVDLNSLKGYGEANDMKEFDKSHSP